MFYLCKFVVAGIVLSAVSEASSPVTQPEAKTDSLAGVADVRIVNDRTIDCSSVERIIGGVVSPTMSDRAKTEALWNFLRLRTFHKSPGHPTPEMANPVTILNLHGQMQCGPCGGMLAALAREAGLPADIARGQGHVITEVFYDNAWRMYDSDMHNYYVKADGSVASVHEIANDPALRFGPPHKSYPWFNGHDWLSGVASLYTPDESMPFDKPRPTDAAYVDSKRKNPTWKYHYRLDLRPGMTVVWSWFPDPDIGYARVNYLPEDMAERAQRDQPWPDAMRGGLPTSPLPALPGFGANGRLMCDFADGWRALHSLGSNIQNLTVTDGLLHQIDPSKPGSFEVELALPYYFADGWIDNPLPASGLVIDCKTEGKPWQRIWPDGGEGKRLRLYDVLNCRFRATLRFTFEPGSELRVKPLRIVGVFHHNYTVLPALLPGATSVSVLCKNEAALAGHPLDVDYVYDQANDQRKVVRRTARFRVLPGATRHTIDTGSKHWPLMREIRMTCLLSADTPPQAAPPPSVVADYTDWGSYPYSKATPGVNYYQDFERGDRDGWQGKLVTHPTYRGSDFALDNSLATADGDRQLKVYRNMGVLNHDTHVRFAAYVSGVRAVELRTQDRTDTDLPGLPHDGSTEDKPDAWYEILFSQLKQNEWNVLECGVDELRSPAYPGRPLPPKGRLAGFYIRAMPADGVAEKDVVFVIDDFLCWDEGIMKKDPLASAPPVTSHP